MKVKSIFLLLAVFLSFQMLYGQQQIIDNSVEYLSQHGQNPADYIISKFETKDIILLSEEHRVKENLEFLQSLIPKLYNAGVFNIGMEFGASEDQAKLDSLVTSKNYDENIAREIMFNYNSGWAFKEYMDVYKAAWEFNKSLGKNQPKFRVINLSYKYNWSSFNGMRTPENMKIVFHKGNTEVYRLGIVEKEIIEKNQKILIITGDVHAFTKYQYPMYDFLAENFVRFENSFFGNLLYKKYGDKVFSVLLHKPFSNYPNKQPFLVSPANGNIEKIMAILNSGSIAFDLNSTPLGELSDSSYYSMGYNNFKLSDIYDGYIFLDFINNLHGCTVDTLFLNDKNWPLAIQSMADPDWRPRAKNIDEYWKQIYEYADISKRYSEVDK